MRWLPLVLVFAFHSASAETISGKVIAVIDGDTITILDAQKKQYKIRLAEIDAPEREQAFWVQSSRSLARLCFKKQAQVEWQGKDQNKRYVGHVTCDGVEANAEQVRRGMAWVSPRLTKPGSPLYELEAFARLRGLGLWVQSQPIPPWEWRAQGDHSFRTRQPR